MIPPDVRELAETQAAKDRELLAMLRKGAYVKLDRGASDARSRTAREFITDIEARAFGKPRNLAIRPKKKRRR